MLLPSNTTNRTCGQAVAKTNSSAMCGKKLPSTIRVDSNIAFINFRSDPVNDGSTGFQVKYEGGTRCHRWLSYISFNLNYLTY